MALDANIQKLVDQAKKAGHRVFSTSIAGKAYIYRSISRAEFRELQKIVLSETAQLREIESPEEFELKSAEVKDRNEDRLVAMGLVHPVAESELDIANVASAAGVVTTLSDLIMTASGFGAELEPTEL
jgi:hypothetical protein